MRVTPQRAWPLRPRPVLSRSAWSAWSAWSRSLSWARVVVDSAGVYVERVGGPGHARWTVRIGERDAVVLEPESYLDGGRSDFPLRTVRSVSVSHESRQRHVVVFDRDGGQTRLVCRDPSAAARIASRCSALRGTGEASGTGATFTAR